MFSIYIHIPFCSAKCAYCDFFSIPSRPESVPRSEYLNALETQLDRDAVRFDLSGRKIGSIFIGGGTPSILPPTFYSDLISSIDKRCRIVDGCEISCEANPATADGLWFREMVALGVNRFSIGVQTFQNDKLKILGRIHSSDDAMRSVAEALESGAESVSVDLMYGLPHGTLSDVEKDIKTAMMFQPQHISAYQLTIEENTPLARMIANSYDRLGMPSDDEILKQFRIARRMLGRGGWEPYEISNYSKPGFECRHNLNYWRYGEYLGLGAGATSFVGSNRWTAVRNVVRYINDPLVADEKEEISRRTAMGEFCFMGLRTREGISLDGFSQKFGLEFESVFPGVASDLCKKGLANISDDRLSLTQKGIELSNTVFTAFV